MTPSASVTFTGMRVNLIAQVSHHFPSESQSMPVSLMIRPARGLPGDFTYKTDSRSLLQMLKRDTELPSSVIDRFKMELRLSPSVRLLGVDLSDQALTDIGYFV